MTPQQQEKRAEWFRSLAIKLDWYERILAVVAPALIVWAFVWARESEHVDAKQDTRLEVLETKRARDDKDYEELRPLIMEILQRVSTVEALIRAKEK